MTKADALKKCMSHIKKEYDDVVILSIVEKSDRFLFEFCEKNDDFPIDYPVISIKKKSGDIDELSFVNKKDREIIFQ